jgi:hypothetical protein
LPVSRKLFLLILAAGFIRLLNAIHVPLLAGEVYYWLWGQFPAAGYYDHPPMIGFITMLFWGDSGPNRLTVRGGAIILGLATILCVYIFAKKWSGSAEFGWKCALLFTVTPVMAMLGISPQPDTGLLLFMPLTWWAFWSATRNGKIRWWALAGLFGGLALLSKFMAWVLLPPLILYLAVVPAHRHHLKSPGPWITIVLWLVVDIPNLYWNATHEWANYIFQFHRSEIPESSFQIRNLLFFWIGAAASISPIIFVTIVKGIGLTARHHLRDERVLFLLFAGLPLPLFLAILSFAVQISLHWPSCGYIPLIILCIHYFERTDYFKPGFQRWAWRTAFGLTLFMHFSFSALSLAMDRVPDNFLGEQHANNIRRLKRWKLGWHEMGRVAAREFESLSARGPAFMMSHNLHMTAQLALYSGYPGQCLAIDYTRENNFRFWRRERGDLTGHNALVVLKKNKPNKKHSRLATKYDKYHRYLDPLFDKVKPIPSLVVYGDGTTERFMGVEIDNPRIWEFLFFQCYGYNGKQHDLEEPATRSGSH